MIRNTTQSSQNTFGILACLVSTAGYTLNDGMIKLVSSTVPQGEIIAVRSLFAFLLIGLVVIPRHGFSAFNIFRYGAVKLRVAAEVAATIFYLAALFKMQIGNTVAILQVIPLLVTVGGGLFFRETIGFRRWIAIALGFFGVLLIIRPGMEGFNVWSLSALAGAVCMATRDLSTRRIPVGVPTLNVALLTTVAVGLFGLFMAPFEEWRALDLKSIGLLALAAGFILTAYISIILAIRWAKLTVIAPFQYSTVVWAFMIGYVFWGEIPDFPTVVGITILVATGTYTFFRERKLEAQRGVN